MRLTNKKKEKKDIGYGVKTLIWNIPSFFHLTGEAERCRVLREIDRSKLRLQLQTRILGQDQHHVRPLVHQGPLPGGHWDDGQGGHDRKVSDSSGSFLQGCWRNQVRDIHKWRHENSGIFDHFIPLSYKNNCFTYNFKHSVKKELIHISLLFYYYPPSSGNSSCIRTDEAVMCLHTWGSPAN